MAQQDELTNQTLTVASQHIRKNEDTQSTAGAMPSTTCSHPDSCAVSEHTHCLQREQPQHLRPCGTTRQLNPEGSGFNSVGIDQAAAGCTHYQLRSLTCRTLTTANKRLLPSHVATHNLANCELSQTHPEIAETTHASHTGTWATNA